MQTKRKIWFRTKEGITGVLVAFGLILGGIGIGAYAKTWSTGGIVTADDFNKLWKGVFKYNNTANCILDAGGSRGDVSCGGGWRRTSSTNKAWADCSHRKTGCTKPLIAY